MKGQYFLLMIAILLTSFTIVSESEVPALEDESNNPENQYTIPNPPYSEIPLEDELNNTKSLYSIPNPPYSEIPLDDELNNTKGLYSIPNPPHELYYEELDTTDYIFFELQFFGSNREIKFVFYFFDQSRIAF